MSDPIRLDKLPPPDVVEPLDYETLLATAKAKFFALLPDYTADTESDPAIKLLEVIAYFALVLRQRVNDAARAVMLPFAKGSNLDNLGAFFSVPRLELIPAQPALGIDRVMEDDGDYLERILLAPASYSVAGPEDAYVFHARSASGDVQSASATSPAPGEVVVSVLSRSGDGTAPPALLDAVAAKVSAANVRPMTDDVTSQSAAITRFAIDATLWTYAGPDPDISLGAARTSLDTYLADSRRLGRNITLAGLYAALNVAGIQDVVLHAPTATIVIEDTGAATCTDITLRYGGIGD